MIGGIESFFVGQKTWKISIWRGGQFAKILTNFDFFQNLSEVGHPFDFF
jgi:hypothetical protein